MQVKKRLFRIFKDKSGYYIKINTKKIRIEGVKDDKKFINIIIRNTINKAEKKKTKRKRKVQNKKIHELVSSGFTSSLNKSGNYKNLFDDKINKKILKLKDLEINERLLKAITSQGGPLGWPPSPPPRLALPPPPHGPPALGAPPVAASPPPLPQVIDQGAMQQGLIKARNYLRPVGKDFIFNPKTEEKIYHNNKEYIIPKKI